MRLTSAMPRCARQHCYRLGEVTLAERGVVFTREATDPDRSWVVRIRFSTRALTSVAIRNDPQPDLVPRPRVRSTTHSAATGTAGTSARARREPQFRANPPTPLLAYERRWFLSTRRGCDFGIASLDARGRRSVVVSPRRLRSLVPLTSRSCVWLQAFASAGRRPLSAWALVPRESSEEHSDRGLFGVAFAGRAAR